MRDEIKKWHADKIPFALEYIQKGNSVRGACKRFDICRSSIDNVMKKLGIKSKFKRDKPSWNKGKKGIMPESQKDAIRIANCGKSISKSQIEHHKNVMKGKPSWNKGKHFSDLQKKKLSLSKKLAYRNGFKNWNAGLTKYEHPSLEVIAQKMSGKNSPNWKGGITPKNVIIRRSIEYKVWNRKVLTRDNFKCQFCGIHNDELETHHIIPFREDKQLIFEINNGITLCKECHKPMKNNEFEWKFICQFIVDLKMGEINA